eukprot:COSAG04_NODE_20551_length_391_cov_0.804795_2_plen_38_part_01
MRNRVVGNPRRRGIAARCSVNGWVCRIVPPARESDCTG